MRYLYVKNGQIEVLEEIVYFNHCPCGERVMMSKGVHDLLEQGVGINCKECKTRITPYLVDKKRGKCLSQEQS